MALLVKEFFRTLQGEGAFAGLPCTLVRLTGCNLRCRWCDSGYAYQGGRPYSVGRLAERIVELGEELALVTGGEPLSQPETPELIEALLAHGLRVVLETNGSFSIGEVPEAAHVALDIKCPGSGEHRRTCWHNLDLLKPGDEIKFVVADAADYRWARSQLRRRRLEQKAQVLFSPVAGQLAPDRLAGWMLRDRLPARLSLQQHKIIWPAGEPTHGHRRRRGR